MPALLTRMSTRPWRCSTPLTIASIDAESVTSSGTASSIWPAPWRRHLAHDRISRRRGIALRFGIDVGDDRHARVLDRDRAQVRRETILRRLQQRAVERRADGQWNHAPGAERLRALAGALHR